MWVLHKGLKNKIFLLEKQLNFKNIKLVVISHRACFFYPGIIVDFKNSHVHVSDLEKPHLYVNAHFWEFSFESKRNENDYTGIATAYLSVFPPDWNRWLLLLSLKLFIHGLHSWKC